MTALTDGRRARAERHREAVVRALLDLIRETSSLPAVDEVAARAKVSKRTVFRLFEDLTTLHIEAVKVQRADVLSRFPPPLPGSEGLSARVAALVGHRADVYEYVMPVRRFAERRRDLVPQMAKTLASDRRAFRAHVELLLGEHVKERGDAEGEVLHGVELATSWSSWRTLRHDQGCSVPGAKRVMELSVRRLLGA